MAENERKQRKAANTQGQPVKLQSKILAVETSHQADPTRDVVFAAQAAGCVTSLQLSSNEVFSTPGTRAPVTSLAFHNAGSTMQAFAGCWDKSVWRYTFHLSPSTSGAGSLIGHTSFPAHSDFVKCLLVVRTPDKQDILISGGADGDVRLWTLDGQPLATLRPQSRGIECLVLDPLSSPDAPVVMFSTSKQEIYSFTLPAASQISMTQIQLSMPLLVHQTSVYKLHFDDDGDLWTASADKTAKQLLRNDGWKVEVTLPHPDFVRDVVTHDRYGWVITACRDEEVRVWNKATGDLHHIFTGHFEEVTGLCLTGDLVISASIDATIRRWSLAPTDLQKAVEEAKKPRLLEQDPEPATDLPMLTEEEEAELRALMESEEEETLEKMARDEQ